MTCLSVDITCKDSHLLIEFDKNENAVVRFGDYDPIDVACHKNSDAIVGFKSTFAIITLGLICQVDIGVYEYLECSDEGKLMTIDEGYLQVPKI